MAMFAGHSTCVGAGGAVQLLTVGQGRCTPAHPQVLIGVSQGMVPRGTEQHMPGCCLGHARAVQQMPGCWCGVRDAWGALAPGPCGVLALSEG